MSASDDHPLSMVTNFTIIPMKTYINIFILLGLLLSVSCKDWLDVKPDTDATEGQIFSTGDGYRSVLNGLYKAMASKTLYGRELSFGVVDCLSQQYNINESTTYVEEYLAADKYNFKDNYLAEIIDNIWEQGFNVIANANNLIQNTEKASPDLFSEGETERRLILGEAYACRALMHFDLLRLYAPAPVSNAGKKPYVPYVETYPDIQANGIDVESFLEKVTRDLETACALVMDFDTTALGRSVMASGRSRFYNELEYGMEGYNDYSVDGFFKGRGYRLNYYSITALLARVYQYAGKYSEAREKARQVLDFQVKDSYGSTLQYFKDDFSGVQSANWDNKSDLRQINNLIFAVYNKKAMQEMNLDVYFKPEFDDYYDDPCLFVINEANQKTFYTSNNIDESHDDYRKVYLVMMVNQRYPISGKWYCSTNEKTRDRNVTILPVIRSTEMCYIEAESYAREGNFSEAKRILESVRAARGCREALHISDWKDFVNELVRDARREWISEGQLFYLYKRLNADVDFGGNEIRPLRQNEYLLPIPDNQSL